VKKILAGGLATMSVSNFIVVDADSGRANGLSRALSALGYAFPVTRLEEVGEAWPDECAIFVADHEGQLARAIEFIRERGIFYPIIPFSPSPTAQRVVETVRCGVMTYLDWPCDQEQLERTLSSIGDSCDILFKEGIRREQAFELIRTLTERESEVLNRLASGASSKMISSELGISSRTVEVHRTKILSKLKVRNAIGAVRLALELKLPEVPPAYH